MKINLFPAVFLVLLLLGCKNEDEINPEVLTQNQWLRVYEYSDADQPYDIVYSIDFKSDGKVYSEVFVRDMETKNVLGFLEYYNGTYQIIENKVTVSIIEHFINMGGTFYSNKEGLSLQNIENQSREYQLRKNNSELHTLMPLYASSLGIIYKRID
ncbi:hypothetical protein [Algoriphagus chordae]|uniref:Lipocalin-like protein n=1 Tax=Algoriphagus chordae TaxID=237019 RepID=A0A2W7R4M5_9BACT|nr:hypothetical protein [Algoriphagus chordae]PZX55793.1 hypothetical protein LV85_01018 [Algoriphagus chordae]